MDLQLIVFIGGKVRNIYLLSILYKLIRTGLFIELLVTFVFITVILMVTIDNKSKSPFAPIYIGIALCVCILASLVYIYFSSI